ncbi:hypothetical protein B0H17DRAFT_1217566 [Mycena rosella]|uniref:Uncharacterized protein n=1 Tax=Mycena rosella TaxID=1033263 RepID=A0AAD7BVK3_MYCRO|nr:hypothetical protein B0H17DRAFT_1217566 [Mycena rosella]
MHDSTEMESSTEIDPATEEESASEQFRQAGIRCLQTDPEYIQWAVKDARQQPLGATICSWCRTSGQVFRCTACTHELLSCGPCCLIAHEQYPLHRIEEWMPVKDRALAAQEWKWDVLIAERNKSVGRGELT